MKTQEIRERQRANRWASPARGSLEILVAGIDAMC